MDVGSRDNCSGGQRTLQALHLLRAGCQVKLKLVLGILQARLLL